MPSHSLFAITAERKNFEMFVSMNHPTLTFLFGDRVWPLCAKVVIYNTYCPSKNPSIPYQSKPIIMSECFHVWMFLYQGRWKQIPSLALHWSVQGLPDHCIQTVTQESPVSSSNSSQTAEQTKVNREPLVNQPIAYLCLQPVSATGACEHRAIWCSTWA